MELDYPRKILLAWAEAISGNKKITDWLMKNGYPELGVFCFALRNKDDAREWLLKNGHPHLMALINGAEGNPNALKWLEANEYLGLCRLAKAIDNDDESMIFIRKKELPEWFYIAQKAQFLKNQIHADNEDVHKFSKD